MSLPATLLVFQQCYWFKNRPVFGERGQERGSHWEELWVECGCSVPRSGSLWKGRSGWSWPASWLNQSSLEIKGIRLVVSVSICLGTDSALSYLRLWLPLFAVQPPLASGRLAY